MLTDPMSITYNGSAKTLARKSGRMPNSPRVLGRSLYGTADLDYTVATQQMVHNDGSRRAEIILSKETTDVDPATAASGYFRNSVGLIVVTNPLRVGTTDLVDIRTSLLALVDTVLMNRLANGEH